MNKLMGFFELKATNIPSVPWNEFTQATVLNPALLWTVRVAVETGMDLNLPRIIGAEAEEAQQCGRKLLKTYGDIGIVVYYPYFIAEKSGVMEISPERIVIEAVEKDLWNFVTNGHKNVSMIYFSDEHIITGDKDFLQQSELLELQRFAAVIRGRFRNELAEGLSVLAEWSFAYNTDTGTKPIGERYLVFYELRTV